MDLLEPVYRPGGTFFFTLATGRRQPHFRNPLQVQYLRTALRQVMRDHPFHIVGAVVMPDHLHTVWTLPDEDHAGRWKRVKLRVSRAAGLRGYWDPAVRSLPLESPAALRETLDRLHADPVRHGLADAPADWPQSSFRFWVKRGLYAQDWQPEPAGTR
ncbi:REP-associated tyrosine transposase [Alkalilimnicola ehrlichii MLHE-1]|uniref:Transposase IS200-like domain-containing protein n=1 Tax=Alkalilimnicola ehrlichii (strain ATCC BAA-1101 / DSM 17681 / MLHE-1) TaxID=187272 RepID=Q0A5L5_ALKEH|nr:transposase [Alkalilimnicola ehrlichii]ABI57872.1 conserved hypothetical protein [Alkalilimnicola ehrlichii MLHE-1]